MKRYLQKKKNSLSYSKGRVSLIWSIDQFKNIDFSAIERRASMPDITFYHLEMQTESKQVAEEGKAELSEILGFLSSICSMMLSPESTNEPYKPFAVFHDRRSLIPEDITPDQLEFMEEIFPFIGQSWLKARVGDLLWLLGKPKNPAHARDVIDAYINQEINPNSWLHGVDKGYERAMRLALQLKDVDRQNEIQRVLLEAFDQEHGVNDHLNLSIARLLNRVGKDKANQNKIADRIITLGESVKNSGQYHECMPHFEHAAKLKKILGKTEDEVGCYIHIAEAYELLAQERLSSENPSNLAANTFYNDAIQAYRSVPTQHREQYSVDEKIVQLMKKLAETGRASLDEMTLISTGDIDISELVEQARSHVAGRESLGVAIRCFVGLSRPDPLAQIKTVAENIMKESLLSTIFGSTQMAADGRVVAKTPGADFSDQDNEAALHHKMVEHFKMGVQLTVQGKILPALEVLLSEQTVAKQAIAGVCAYSKLVAEDRISLMTEALWLGFEWDFSTAIYLLCPQFEHIVRTKLKALGVKTSNLDSNGIEQENGLSSLFDLAETKTIFGEDLFFELKSIFTDSLGYNLRNEVAHGLLDDNSSRSSASIYAWWLILRIIVLSIYDQNTADAENAEESENDDQ